MSSNEECCKGVKLGVHAETKTAWWIHPGGTYSFVGPADLDTCLECGGAIKMDSQPPQEKIIQ